ncbi:MAG: hypothetical protein RLZ04_684, partial [Actinomycetota bacterium]
AHDTTVHDHRAGVPAGLCIAPDPVAACRGAAVLVVLTEWDDYRWIDPAGVVTSLAGRSVVDARNLLDRVRWQKAGLVHQGVGR